MAAVPQMIAGNIVADIELMTTPGGRNYTRFRVATNERYRNNEGEWKQHDAVYWHVEAWGHQAEVLRQQFRKGSPIILMGPMRTQNWQTEDGQPRSRNFIKLEAFGPNLAIPPRAAAPEPVDDEPQEAAAATLDDWAAQA